MRTEPGMRYSGLAVAHIPSSDSRSLYHSIRKGIMANRRAIGRNIVFASTTFEWCLLKICLHLHNHHPYRVRQRQRQNGIMFAIANLQHNSHFQMKSSVPKKLSVKISVCHFAHIRYSERMASATKSEENI